MIDARPVAIALIERIVVHDEMSAAAVGSIVVEVAPITRWIAAHVAIIVVDRGCRRKRDAVIVRRDRVVGVGCRGVRVDGAPPHDGWT